MRAPISRSAVTWKGLLGAGTLAALLTWIFNDRVWFIGDFVIRQGSAETGFFLGNFQGSLPLDVFLHNSLARMISLNHAASAATVARILGAVEAATLAVLSLGFARALERRGWPAIATASIVFFGGYLTVFTGLAKPASEMCLATAGVAMFGTQVVRRGTGHMALGLTMALAMLVHRSAVLLLPAWVTIYALWLGGPRRGAVPGRAWLGMGIPVVVAAVMLSRMVAIIEAFDMSHHLFPGEVRSEGILRSSFSVLRVADLANLLLVLCPLLLPAIALFVGRHKKLRPPDDGIVLAVLATSFVPVFVLVHPQQGIFRDWDVFASAGVALSLWVAKAVGNPVVGGTMPGLMLAAAINTATPCAEWILLNHSTSAGLHRIRAFLTECPTRPEAERAWTWDFLGVQHFRLGEWAQAANAEKQAAELAPHRRIFLLWGIAESRGQQYVRAQQVYRRLLERNSYDPLGWLGLAGASIRLGDSAQATLAVGQLRRYAADRSALATMRRFLLYFPDVWPYSLARARPGSPRLILQQQQPSHRS